MAYWILLQQLSLPQAATESNNLVIEIFLFAYFGCPVIFPLLGRFHPRAGFNSLPK
jgi:hypothetical protein